MWPYNTSAYLSMCQHYCFIYTYTFTSFHVINVIIPQDIWCFAFNQTQVMLPRHIPYLLPFIMYVVRWKRKKTYSWRLLLMHIVRMKYSCGHFCSLKIYLQEYKILRLIWNTNFIKYINKFSQKYKMRQIEQKIRKWKKQLRKEMNF